MNNHSFLGDQATITLSGIEIQNVSVGNILCDPQNPIPVASKFEARIVVFNIAVPITKGYSVSAVICRYPVFYRSKKAFEAFLKYVSCLALTCLKRNHARLSAFVCLTMIIKWFLDYSTSSIPGRTSSDKQTNIAVKQKHRGNTEKASQVFREKLERYRGNNSFQARSIGSV